MSTPYKRPAVHQPTSWQEATADTIARIQRIFSLAPDLTLDQKLTLYAQAHQSTVAQGRADRATEYWGTFVNILRTLVAGLADVDPRASFD